MNQVTWFSKQSYVNQILIRRILQHTAKLNVMSWCQVLRGSSKLTTNKTNFKKTEKHTDMQER